MGGESTEKASPNDENLCRKVLTESSTVDELLDKLVHKSPMAHVNLGGGCTGYLYFRYRCRDIINQFVILQEIFVERDEWT